MGAIAKINALTVPFLAKATGRPASIVYRWRAALAAGRGIRDANKRQLIAASVGTPHPIGWADFEPAERKAA